MSGTAGLLVGVIVALLLLATLGRLVSGGFRDPGNSYGEEATKNDWEAY
jgi:hypothetical protein